MIFPAVQSWHMAHDQGRWFFLAQQLSHDLHGFIDVIEKSAVTFTQVVQARFTSRGLDDAILGAATIAYEAHLTIQTVLRQSISFRFAELALIRPHHDFSQRYIHDVAQVIIGFYIVVTTIDGSFMFDG